MNWQFPLNISKRFIVRLAVACASLITVALAGLLWFCVLLLRHDPENQRRNWETTPTNVEELRSLEQRVQSAIRLCLPASVGVESSGPGATSRDYASGVVISADGLILTQAHVCVFDYEEKKVRRHPGDRVGVVLNDGREVESVLVGADLKFDHAVLRLVDPGPHPYVSFDPAIRANIGDWVIKLGHPLQYRRDRPAVARLGRVLYWRDGGYSLFNTDCELVGGDSGGPFFDLNGRLVGILGPIASPTHIAGGIDPPGNSGSCGPWFASSNKLIQWGMKRMLAGELISHDENVSFRTNDLFEETLPRKHWKNGHATVRAFHDVIQDTRRSVVEILNDEGRVVAHGVIANSDGDIVTLASFLPRKPRVRLSRSEAAEESDAEIVGKDLPFDLALLKVREDDLPAIRWTTKPTHETGTMIASVGMSKVALGFGIISVPQRTMVGPFPTMSARRPVPFEPLQNRRDPGHSNYSSRPAVFGWKKEGPYLIDMAAPHTGLELGDRLISVAGKTIKWDSDLIKCCANLSPGEKVPVSIVRDGQRRQLDADLSPVPMYGSTDYSEYPTLFEHDTPLNMIPLGAPVVDLDGNAIGITVYRSAYGSLAIPGECIMQFVLNSKSNSR